MSNIPEKFIDAIPKTDLHLHLDGSMRPETLIEIAKSNKIELPSYDVEGLNELIFKENYDSLDEYLRGFALTCAAMQTTEAIEQIAYELAIDNFNEGVRYIEVRFAPQLLINKNQNFEDVVIAADKGLRRAKREINSSLKAEEPPFEYGIIICAMRFCNEKFSPFYKQFFEAHRYSPGLRVIRLASMEAAQASVKIRNESDVQVVGFDLAGSEYGYPADDHKKSYDHIHRNFLKKTVHAGEAYGPESIFQAITELHADRIGHGLHLFDDKMVYSENIADKKQYVERLVNYIADRRITIEVCLTSNIQTDPSITLENHSFGKMLDNRLSVTFCTDNRLVSHTSVSNEIRLALKHFPITSKQLKNIIIYGFKRSFYYNPYKQKREYVRKVINYYEKLEKQFGVAE